MARDIILNLAVSLDGFICDEDGDFAWIGGQGDGAADTAEAFDFDAFLASCDTVVMGRKAYDDCGISHISGAAGKRFLVATHTPRPPAGNVTFLSGDVVGQVLALKRRPGGHIWLFGGGELASALIRAGAVDRFIVGILPAIRGGACGCSGRGCRPWSSAWTAAPWRTASPSWSTAAGRGEVRGSAAAGRWSAAGRPVKSARIPGPILVKTQTGFSSGALW